MMKFNQGMTHERRLLMLSVWNGENQVLPHLHMLDNFHRCDQVLGWLIKNQLTGQRFLDWMRFEQGNSLLKAISFVQMKINRDRELRPLFVGRDLT